MRVFVVCRLLGFLFRQSRYARLLYFVIFLTEEQFKRNL